MTESKENKIEMQIGEWEDARTDNLHTLAIRTAALLSAQDNVPNEVLNALMQIESGEENGKSIHIYHVVKYLRSLV